MITWNEIAAECTAFRSGLVAVFKRYEGEPTDERDASGRVVKVTATSFAAHMGIAKRTFHNWVQREVSAKAAPTSPSQIARDANGVKRMARENPAALLDAIEAAGPSASDQVFHEHKLRRAGVDTTRAGRKRADAIAHEQTEPFRRAMARTHGALCVAALNDAIEELRAALEEGIDEDVRRAIIEASDNWTIALLEIEMRDAR